MATKPLPPTPDQSALDPTPQFLQQAFRHPARPVYHSSSGWRDKHQSSSPVTARGRRAVKVDDGICTKSQPTAASKPPSARWKDAQIRQKQEWRPTRARGAHDIVVHGFFSPSPPCCSPPCCSPGCWACWPSWPCSLRARCILSKSVREAFCRSSVLALRSSAERSPSPL